MFPSHILRLLLVASLMFTVQSYRPISGYGNNKLHPTWGQSGTTHMGTQGVTSYEDGKGVPISSLPLARLISNVISDDSNRAAFRFRPQEQVLSDLHVMFGQLVNHDMQRTPDSTEPFFMPVPDDDEYFSFPIPFYRSVYTNSTSGVRMPINNATAFVDLSPIYGSTDAVSKDLRLGKNGLMAYVVINGDVYPPYQPNSTTLHYCGDDRCNNNPILLALHSLFIREHNRIAVKLKKANPTWDDEILFQESRRWTVAYYQSVAFNQYIPITIGKPLDHFTYDPTLDPSACVDFSAVADRYGHSSLNSAVLRLTAAGTTIEAGTIELSPECMGSPPCWVNEGVDPIIRGAVSQPHFPAGVTYISGLRNVLFHGPRKAGTDLASIDITRGRDHGVPLYNDMREAYGLSRVNNCSEVTNNKLLCDALLSVYESFDQMDAVIGGLAEDHISKGSVGELFAAIIEEQATRVRNADRFYFLSPDASFTPSQIDYIGRTRLSDIILRNTGVTEVPCNSLIVDDSLPKCTLNGVLTPDTDPNAQGSGTLTVLGVTLTWELLSTETIAFTLQSAGTGWMAVGFPQVPGKMIDTDAVVCWIINGTAFAVDYTLNGKETKCPAVCPDADLGGTDDVTLISGNQNNGITEISFSRPLRTGDTLDHVIDIQNQPILIAFDPVSPILSYHAENKIAAVISSTGSATVSTDFQYLKTAHGLLMFFATLVLSPFAVFSSRLLGRSFTWKKIHVFTQMITLTTFFSGFFVIYHYVAVIEGTHFVGTHQIVGVVLLCILCLTSMLGIVVGMRFKAPDSFPIHKLFGYTTMFLGVFQVWLGFDTYGDLPLLWFWLILAYTLTLFVLYFFVAMIRILWPDTSLAKLYHSSHSVGGGNSSSSSNK